MARRTAHPHDGPMAPDTATAPPSEPSSDPTTELPPPPPPFTAPSRPLRRTTIDRHVAGVAGGIARYLRISPTLVRIAFVVVTVISLGIGLSLYVAAWLLLPDDEDDTAPAVSWFRDHGSGTGAIILLVALAAVAVIAVTGLVAVVDDGDAGAIPFLAGIGIVGYLIATRSKRGERPPRSAAEDQTAVVPATTRVPVDPVVAARRARQRTVRNTTVLAALVVGFAGTVLWATGAMRTSAWVVPAAVLAVLLIGLAAGVVVGWSWLVALLVILVTPVLVVSLIPGTNLRGGVGTRLAVPQTAADVAPRYRLGVGSQEVDLTQLALEPGSSTTVRVAVGIGTATVRVPADAVVHLRGHVSMGDVTVDGRDIDLEGTDVKVDRILDPVAALPADEGDPRVDRPRVDVVLDIGIGSADIARVT